MREERSAENVSKTPDQPSEDESSDESEDEVAEDKTSDSEYSPNTEQSSEEDPSSDDTSTPYKRFKNIDSEHSTQVAGIYQYRQPQGFQLQHSAEISLHYITSSTSYQQQVNAF